MLSVGMMITDYHYNYLGFLRSGISVVVYPVKYLASLPSNIYQASTEALSSRKKLLNENTRLRTDQILLGLQLQKLAVLEQENARLRELFSSAKQLEEEQVLIAELLAIDLDPYRHRIVLNKGTQDGVYEGQPLLGAKGIIGQIDKAGPVSSIAILVTDPNHALLGVIARSGQRSLVVGTGSNDKLELRHLVNETDMQIGDLITTSGLDGLYPPNYPVAKIVSIQQIAGEAFVRVEAKPLTDLNTIRETLLLRNSEGQFPKTAENTTETR